MTGELEQWLAGRRERPVSLKGEDCILRVATALEVLEARRETAELMESGEEKALCANACLLAKALYRKDQRVFEHGGQVLEKLTPGEIGKLAAELAELDRAENPSPEDAWAESVTRKKALSTRPMSG